MDVKRYIAGIDIGSVSVSIVIMDAEGTVKDSVVRAHRGDVKSVLTDMLGQIDRASIGAWARTSSSPDIVKGAKGYDAHVSLIRAVKDRHPGVRSILYVGGERFGLVEFDDAGVYRRARVNSSCAAGTGSFLDQQAKRLSLSGIEEFCAIAKSNSGEVPKIASRCAVFAKTDLIHAQQEGFTLAEICDGLCMGLAKNIVDTLFSGEKARGPMIMAGGVALNDVVARHLEKLIGIPVIRDEYAQLYGAIGVVLGSIRDYDDTDESAECAHAAGGEILDDISITRSYYYQPLDLRLSSYPPFESREKYEYNPVSIDTGVPVEVDIYADISDHAPIQGYLGIDIGSTSTKAAILSNNRVIAGLYTRTSGRPLEAVKGIFEAIDDIIGKKNVQLTLLGAGTTGSGRKFIGRIIGADLVLDEITAHARAARELNPDVDTIIEIGGQDAKFTTLRNGTVNFSVMNTVCAAGTGSFIEEQAHKLGCPLSEYSGRTVGKRSPIASDRCTVFMERDINHLLSRGYTVDEALAAVLHSVRDNYLSKVAVEAAIGRNICFQGATAKNRALVAAFEQKLEKPIFVSEYCHLTGALGVAYSLADREAAVGTVFRGIGIYRQDIPVTGEVCDLCANHCKIRIAHFGDETVAYGFLCGRDYDTKSFVDSNSSGFDLIRERARIMAVKPAGKEGPTIGLPAALHMAEEMALWKSFFAKLGIRTVSSEGYRDAVKNGKHLAGAEFCAPMAAAHGHLTYCAEHADHIFFPLYTEGRNPQKGTCRQYCYYTQFMPSIAANLPEVCAPDKLISPLVNLTQSIFFNSVQLYKSLRGIFPSVSFFEIYSAYDYAKTEYARMKNDLLRVYEAISSANDDMNVVFVGRPYTLLLPSMNKGIPGLFGSLGVKSVFQDMVPYSREEVKEIEPLLETFHWHFAAKILEVSAVAAKRKGLYPVFVTSFKCSPDSFVIEYFKKIMDSHEKPYLILQLDEHDSNVGYETRIEAAVRAFRNHARGSRVMTVRTHLPVNPSFGDKIKGKTLLLPNWDPISCRLVAATLVRHGIDARLLEENETIIAKSMRHNTGQCIPINAIAQETIDYIEKYHLHPENTALWMIDSTISCNIRLYPSYIKHIFETHGRGLEKTDVYVGEVTFSDLGPTVSFDIYFAYFFGGMIRKLACKIRPYEKNRGETDRIAGQCGQLVYSAIISGSDREDTARGIADLFGAIERTPSDRPKVAIFGDLYTRDNDVMNQNLIRTIEEAGGEAVITSYAEYMRMIASPYFKRWFSEGKYFDVVTGETLLALVNIIDRKYYRIFEPLLGVPYPEFDRAADEILKPFGITTTHTGESLDNILKITYLSAHHPDLSLFVQASPAFCCPSLVTEAMSRDIERITGVPVVSITYDGTGTLRNDVIIPYIVFARKKAAGKEKREEISGA
jgi:predicted CoA-substrate-specific enzyme activase